VDPPRSDRSLATTGLGRICFPAARSLAGVIIEHALLPVTPGREAAFERAFAEAQQIIAGMPGFRRLTLSRGVERPTTYLLLVEWDRLEDHTEGFRGSPAYQDWRALLHHFAAVLTADPQEAP
jgi:heme-degrading monooxygenase HmoA